MLNYWQIAWDAKFKANIPIKISKKTDAIEYRELSENIFISKDYRHKSGISKLKKALPMFDFRIKPIVETHGVVNFRRYWYGHNRAYRHYVSDFLTKNRYCLAFRHRSRSARVWYRIERLHDDRQVLDFNPKTKSFLNLRNADIRQLNKKEWLVIYPMALEYSRWRQKEKISNKFGTYKYKSIIKYRKTFKDLQLDYKKKIFGM
jgi:hypothetical protein